MPWALLLVLTILVLLFSLVQTTNEGFFNVTPGSAKISSSELIAQIKVCEAVKTMDCKAFDDSKFNLNCGICLDTGKNSVNASITGGGLVMLSDHKISARKGVATDIIPGYVPTVGFCPISKLVTSKDECMKLQGQLLSQTIASAVSAAAAAAGASPAIAAAAAAAAAAAKPADAAAAAVAAAAAAGASMQIIAAISAAAAIAAAGASPQAAAAAAKAAAAAPPGGAAAAAAAAAIAAGAPASAAAAASSATDAAIAKKSNDDAIAAAAVKKAQADAAAAAAAKAAADAAAAAKKAAEDSANAAAAAAAKKAKEDADRATAAAAAAKKAQEEAAAAAAAAAAKKAKEEGDRIAAAEAARKVQEAAAAAAAALAKKAREDAERAAAVAAAAAAAKKAQDDAAAAVAAEKAAKMRLAAVVVGVQSRTTGVASIQNAPDINSKLVPSSANNPKMEVHSEFRFIIYNGDYWLAGGPNHLGGRLMSSKDAQNWTLVPSMDNIGGIGSSFDYGFWTGKRWIIALMSVKRNYTYEYFSSRDGNTWTPFTTGQFGNIGHIAGTESILVGVGHGRGHWNGQYVTYYSTDGGKRWSVSDDSGIFDPTQGGGLMTVKYNGSMFVAGGMGDASGKPVVIIYSINGLKWTKANVPAMNTRVWNLASNGKAWIAATQYDGVLYSPDGINWQMTNFPKSDWSSQRVDSLYAVLSSTYYSKSLNRWFCSTQFHVYSSTDGMNWSILYSDIGKATICIMADYTPPPPDPVVSGPKSAITIGVQDPYTAVAGIHSAPDINAYVSSYLESNPKWQGNSEIRFLLYNGKQWITGGPNHSGGRLMSSKDGQNWSIIPSMENLGGPGSAYAFGLWTGRRWIVALVNVSKNYSMEFSSSTDGITWLPLTTGYGNITHIAGTESMLVAVGMNAGHYNQKVLYNSTDGGKTWKVTDDSTIFSQQHGGGAMCVTYNGSMFVAGGMGNASGSPVVIIYSTDGTKWTKANVPAINARVWNLASNGKAWIAGMQYDGMLYSPDGINWQKTTFKAVNGRPAQAPSINIYPNGLSWSKSLNRWFCSTTLDIFSSTDGINWTVLYPGLGMGVVCVMADF